MITSRTLLPPNAGGLLYFIEGSPPAARPVGGSSVMVYTRRPGGTRDEQGFSPVPGTARARFAARDHPGQEAGEPCRVRADRPPGPSGTRGKVPGPSPRAAAESQVRAGAVPLRVEPLRAPATLRPRSRAWPGRLGAPPESRIRPT